MTSLRSTNEPEGITGSAYAGLASGGRFDYTSQLIPQTAPADYSSNPLYTPATPHVQESLATPLILTSLPTPTAHDRLASPASYKASNGNLAALSPSIHTPLSRESRISLPDEAKQYIANMTESPVPSPKVDTFNKTPSTLSRSFVPVSPGRDKDQEFLDMDEEDDEGDVDDDDDEGDEPDEDYEVVSASGSTPAPESSQDLDQPPIQSETSSSSSISVSARSRPYITVPETFPTPPTTMSPHAEARAEAAYQRQLTADSQMQQFSSSPAFQRSNDDLRPQRLDTQNLPSSTTAGNAAPSPAGFFRALPLLPTDLPRTKINVSHSFVRPNERGKEVLSFIVLVDPGKGKEGWKVEKMYSDVLNLDQRVRTSVGKSVGKKIATLPEGKLWKDHAPAKADQRKVLILPVTSAIDF